jgi:hypothetical protein
MTRTTWIVAAVMILGLLFFMFVLGGLVLVLTIVASAVTLLTLPVLILTGKRRRALQLLTAWGIYLGIYLTISTGITMAAAGHEPNLVIGQEVCADSGCFAVDKVDVSASATESLYTLHWHLASNDTQLTKHFPGNGLELFLFNERGRKFALPVDANQNPLDVTVPAGETVRQSMTFRVPADVRELFLTAKYRPFTFQSLLPGELSLIPHRHGKMIRIQ